MDFNLAINVDEIGSNLEDILPFLRKNQIENIELRTIDTKNIANFTQEEILKLKQKISDYNLEVIAIASPLFKWHETITDLIKPSDSYGFPCLLSDQAKKDAIERIVENAKVLNVKKIRIFSGLKDNQLLPYENKLFQYCLNNGSANGVQFLIENEPICHINKFVDVVSILEYFPNLDLWLDVANFYQIGEELNEDKLKILLPRTRHIHLKDFMFESSNLKHLPLGEGVIPWEKLLKYIFSYASNDISFSIEAHMKENKLEAMEKSIKFFRVMKCQS